jgi:hypothetical protein
MLVTSRQRRIQGDQKIGRKFAQILVKVAQTVAQAKNCNIFIKISILKSQTSTLSPSEFYKYLQQTIFSPKIFLAL